MKNHRWKDNTCVKCGVKRKKHYSKLLMAITDYPPYDHYLRKMIWIFSFDGRKWKADRPDCKNVSVNVSTLYAAAYGQYGYGGTEAVELKRMLSWCVSLCVGQLVKVKN